MPALARLATRLRDQLTEAEQTTIESLLADPKLSLEPRIQLQFGLAQVLDARNEFERAAELTIHANALQLADFRNRGLVYDHQAHHTIINQVMAAFSTPFFERVRGFGLETERPVFIVGLPRSGTSLTEQILASHPRVFGAGELKLARDVLETLRGSIDRRETPLVSLEYLDRESTRHLAWHYLNKLAELNDSADRVVDKMPDNTIYLGLIATLFPRAKLIVCRRDVRDVALSCWMTNFRDVRWACDADQIAARIEEHERLMEHWRRVLPVRMLEVDYEAMVTDIEKWARAIVAWCGLDWEPVCLEFHKTRRPVRDLERGPGPPARLHQFRGPLEKLRTVAEIAIREAQMSTNRPVMDLTLFLCHLNGHTVLGEDRDGVAPGLAEVGSVEIAAEAVLEP